MDTCTYLGIYPDNIEEASEIFELVCKKFGIDSDEEWSIILQDFEEQFDIDYYGNFGNRVIGMIFRNLNSALVEKGVNDDRIDWYINGWDTSFIIDGEEVC